MTHTIKERIAARRETYYREVRAHSPHLFKSAIQSAEAISLNFNLPQEVAVEIEWACVASLAHGLGIGSPLPRDETPSQGGGK